MNEKEITISMQTYYALQELKKEFTFPELHSDSDIIDSLIKYRSDNEKAKELRNPDAWNTKVWIFDKKTNCVKQIEGEYTSRRGEFEQETFFTETDGTRHERGTFDFTKEGLLRILNENNDRQNY